MRESFPIFSGPGHSLALFFALAIILFAPGNLIDAISSTDYLGAVVAGFLVIGTTIGIIFNTLYSGL